METGKPSGTVVSYNITRFHNPEEHELILRPEDGGGTDL
jgi:hypothetical protein